jgi:hypothetical protein
MIMKLRGQHKIEMRDKHKQLLDLVTKLQALLQDPKFQDVNWHASVCGIMHSLISIWEK